MKYYLIICQHAHHGRNRSQDIAFAIMAKTLLDAQAQARKMPGVKHTKGILYGKEITLEEYTFRRQTSAYAMFQKY